MITFHIVTIFPEMFDSYLNESILARAIKTKKIKVKFYNPRNFIKNKHKKARPDGRPFGRVDGTPYGGGPGMVMKAEPILRAVAKAQGRKKKVKTIIFSPNKKEFSNSYAKGLEKSYKDIILICGRYEGIDNRVKTITKGEEVSVGPFILTGGELPAMIVMDAVSRQIDGVLGNFSSIEEKRVSSGSVYTKPEILKYKGKNYRVPKVLLSGHHKKIDKWRKSR